MDNNTTFQHIIYEPSHQMELPFPKEVLGEDIKKIAKKLGTNELLVAMIIRELIDGKFFGEK